jgi:hypothetical protein
MNSSGKLGELFELEDLHSRWQQMVTNQLVGGGIFHGESC